MIMALTFRRVFRIYTLSVSDGSATPQGCQIFAISKAVVAQIMMACMEIIMMLRGQ